jgi:hypothetical protein
VFKAIDASKVPGSSFFCHFSPKNYPRTKHTKTYDKIQAIFSRPQPVDPTLKSGKFHSLGPQLSTVNQLGYTPLRG